MSGAFEIVSIDVAQKRIGVALVDEDSPRIAPAEPKNPAADADSKSALGSLGDKLRDALQKR
jgi:RNase H-fold protein (predicted Holliday junction resolvase)